MIAILSDIHGNYVALEQVLKTIDEMEIKDIYCLGDFVGYYPQVNEVCNELRKRGALCVIGNHDWYMLADSFCDRSQSVNDTIGYQKKIISDENLEWLKSLPVYREYQELKMVHGGWVNPLDEYLREPNEVYFSKVGGKYFASGHTHLPRIDDYGTKIYCNPGSVGQPRDGDNRSSFATWDGATFEIHRVAYDYEAVGKLMGQAGFSGYYYERLAIGAKDNGWYAIKDDESADG
ncbi:metallophosphoesterase family protein [Mycobacterium malmoense]|uniref:metallophosphoesterase family protein n=1 Tax=Mycobacterium malmoense TaxID=1780 RepID=UPI0009F1D1E6|nr:metallophosphoesterase family protein [Mycobacterium malmoense]